MSSIVFRFRILQHVAKTITSGLQHSDTSPTPRQFIQLLYFVCLGKLLFDVQTRNDCCVHSRFVI